MDGYHCIFMFQRKKDIPDLRRSTVCVFQDYGKIEQIIRRREIYEVIAKKLNARLYISVNPRDIRKARKDLIVRLVLTDDTDREPANLRSQMFSSLMRNPVRETKRFMLDIDRSDIEFLIKIEKLIPPGFYLCTIKTKNGFHIITKAFDTRPIRDNYPEVEIKRDGMTYMSYLDYLDSKT